MVNINNNQVSSALSPCLMVVNEGNDNGMQTAWGQPGFGVASKLCEEFFGSNTIQQRLKKLNNRAVGELPLVRKQAKAPKSEKERLKNRSSCVHYQTDTSCKMIATLF